MATNTDKGTKHETAIVNYLNRQLGLVREDGTFVYPGSGDNIKRAPKAGVKDVGDIHAYPLCIEAKDEAKHDFPGYIRQARKEADQAGFPCGVAVVKKRNANIKDAYAVMDLETLSRILAALREAS